MSCCTPAATPKPQTPCCKEKTMTASCCEPDCCQTPADALPEAETMKAEVRTRYAEIARASGTCCETAPEMQLMAVSYADQAGYMPEADLGLGCGLPTEWAAIRVGDTVVDLGSGAGNDVFVARRIVGETGRVIGVDMTPDMVTLAKHNAAKLGYTNVEFRLGEIEALPLPSQCADVVVSNCVMNLVPDKRRAFSETFRILKPSGHFSISDIVLEGEVPPEALSIAALYAGCIAGAVQKTDYLRTIEDVGFINIQVHKERVIAIPDELLRQYLSAEAFADLRNRNVQVKSITVYGEKPAASPETLHLKPVTDAHRTEVYALLREAGLPTEDILPETRLFALWQDEHIIGTGGLDVWNDVALLRSIAILPAWKGSGLGQKLVSELEAQASQLGVHQLGLLTTTAADFFARMGYQAVTRTVMPEAIRNTAQFRSICPDSAQAMLKMLV